MFKLLRYFSLTSIVVLAIASVVLGWLYREISRRDFVAMQEQSHAILTEALEQTLWSQFSPLLNASEETAKASSHSQAVQDLDQSVRKLIRQTGVVKVKIYNTRGITVYSSDAGQIGESKLSNAGFIKAVKGKTASELAHRDKFSAFEGVIVDRDLLSSYVAVHNTVDDNITGVFELYSDVTKEMQHIVQIQKEVTLGVLGLLGLIYGVLVLIVKRADRILQQQHKALEDERASLTSARDALEWRVADRTAQLEAKNRELELEAEQRKSAERNAHYLANHDVLTDLPNRSLLDERMQLELTHAQPVMAVLFIDLDNFNTINDAMGHAVGDEILKAIAQRLRYAVRPQDTLARWGGDEFVVLMPHLHSEADAVDAAHQLIGLIATPVVHHGQKLSITASIGVSLFDSHGVTADALFRCADIAMFHAKTSGRNRASLYQPDMQNQVTRRLLTERMLQRALEVGHFQLHYQPQLDMSTGSFVGAEALIRLNDPELGMISPAQFIPLAEENGKIIPIGEWTLREACRMAKRLHDEAGQWQRIAVNLSPRQFHADVPIEQTITHILAETQCDPSALAVEITENVMIDATGLVAESLRAITALGVEVAIDDFGSGYSSFRYLRDLPIHKIKIDQSYTKDLGRSSDSSLVSAMVAVARSLHLEVIAEGVETPEQAAVLQQVGCVHAQGYLYARPMPEAALKDWLKAHALHPHATTATPRVAA